MANKRTGKIEILDRDFINVTGTVDSGNLRVTFRSGATLDIYIADDNATETCLYITSNDIHYQTVLVGGHETDFEITMRKVKL